MTNTGANQTVARYRDEQTSSLKQLFSKFLPEPHFA
jgi:hypothetical protein